MWTKSLRNPPAQFILCVIALCFLGCDTSLVAPKRGMAQRPVSPLETLDSPLSFGIRKSVGYRSGLDPSVISIFKLRGGSLFDPNKAASANSKNNESSAVHAEVSAHQGQTPANQTSHPPPQPSPFMTSPDLAAVQVEKLQSDHADEAVDPTAVEHEPQGAGEVVGDETAVAAVQVETASPEISPEPAVEVVRDEETATVAAVQVEETASAEIPAVGGGGHITSAVARKEHAMELRTLRKKPLTAHMHSVVKYTSFSLLVLQNSALTCTMRWSRTKPGPLYLTSTAVVCAELCKVVVSLALIASEEGTLLGPFWKTLHADFFSKPFECLKLLVPGILYTTQNNLQYVASSRLEPAVFQVMYQVKMLTTALISVTMLKKRLSIKQWGGVTTCMLGLVLVQLSQMGTAPSAVGTRRGIAGNEAVGYAAILSACTMSGFAGCYLERVLKGSMSTSLWIRNLQLATWGFLLSSVNVLVRDRSAVLEKGFFYGYNRAVWTVIGVQAIGGLLISMVVRYGDALMKGFATGLAIIVTTLISVVFFDFKVTPQYVCGASIVFIAILLYSNVPVPKLGVLQRLHLPPKITKDISNKAASSS
uniref:Uncharacterized protein n=1 Tax=Octactis speculum TaxID=3111310 RepID=A0A7S2GWS5_9STRA|mmetsp:Transcript_58825/g.80296  ORF Transcript_58825/g.80296 Transcript_58825/m.80296 type:complete len:592 (+) Transcript_58825:45-1820(+)